MPGAIQKNIPYNYLGPLDTSDAISRRLPVLGGPNPYLAEEQRLRAGRHLAGFGEAPAVSEPTWGDGLVDRLEADDDVVGSGVFDSPGTATVHRQDGVFQDHPSMPGWIARHPPFTPNPEVQDIWGAQVIEVPGGGLLYADRTNLGYTAGLQSTNAWIQEPGQPPHIPARADGRPVVAFFPPGTQRVPKTALVPPTERAPLNLSRPVTAEGAAYPQLRRVPLTPQEHAIAQANTRDVAMRPIPVMPRGFGAEAPPKPAGWPTYLFAGLVVGAAAAMVYGTTKIKPGRGW